MKRLQNQQRYFQQIKFSPFKDLQQKHWRGKTMSYFFVIAQFRQNDQTQHR